MKDRLQPGRPHFLVEWTQKREMTQADLGRAIGADKSLVSRWFKGSTPSREWQEQLAAYFRTSREGLFRDPDEAWMAEMMTDRSPEERARMRAIIEAAFPKK